MKRLDTCRTLSFCLNWSRFAGWKYSPAPAGGGVGRPSRSCRSLARATRTAVSGVLASPSWTLRDARLLATARLVQRVQHIMLKRVGYRHDNQHQMRLLLTP